jgi:hypothetical protein
VESFVGNTLGGIWGPYLVGSVRHSYIVFQAFWFTAISKELLLEMLCASQSYPEGKMSKHIGSLKVGDELEVSWKVGAGYGRAAIVKYSRNMFGSGTDALAVWLDSTPCPGEKEGSQRAIRKSKKMQCR